MRACTCSVASAQRQCRPLLFSGRLLSNANVTRQTGRGRNMGCGPPKRALVHRSWTLKARASGSGAQLIRLITSAPWARSSSRVCRAPAARDVLSVSARSLSPIAFHEANWEGPQYGMRPSKACARPPLLDAKSPRQRVWSPADSVDYVLRVCRHGLSPCLTYARCGAGVRRPCLTHACLCTCSCRRSCGVLGLI